jgi:hypothetical protein
MNKFIVVNDACELCVSEYIDEHTSLLRELPDNQEKTKKIHHIIHGARKASSKPVVRYLCRELLLDAYHNLCVDHLYKMIDAIKEYEENDY